MLAIQIGEGNMADAESGRMCGWRERKDVVLTMVLIEDVVLAMVLIEDVLMLLMMIEQLECKPTTTMAMAIARQQSHTVLGVAVERRPAITITKWAMALGRQQGTRPCRTPTTVQ